MLDPACVVPELVLGPVVRHIGLTDATVWVETDEPCEVAILGHRMATFQVEGHSYAIVTITDLDQGAHAYQVILDDRLVWPDPRSKRPASVVRTLHADDVTLAFGSCRVTAPHVPPAILSQDQHRAGRGVDALRALAMRMTRTAPATWPHCLLLLGDQVYADEVSPQTRHFLEGRRNSTYPHGDEIADFEEYTRLYQEAWQEPTVRWLLSNIATTMLWDDHDVHDDWNISQAWLEHARAQPWWRQRITGAIMSYWLYQHIGNLSPAELEADELLTAVKAAADGGVVLRAFASRAAETGTGVRWSIRRDFGRTRLLGLDCRAGRILTPGARSMLGPEDWRWIEHQTNGEFDHLLIAATTPYLLAPGLHHLESWSEAVCDGAWGDIMAAVCERLRQALDLDHWAAFRRSFEQLTDLLRRVGAGDSGRAPATILVLAGDIHNGSITQVTFPPDYVVQSAVYQVVSSPLRNALGRWERFALRIADSRTAACLGRVLLATVRLRRPAISWHKLAGPWFDNHITTLDLRRREASIRVDFAAPAEAGSFELKTLTVQRITPP